jgi:DHA1 family tetracycline resistance protein-like MFS transporter
VTARTPALGFIFLTLLLDVLGFGLLIPVAPRLIEQLQGGTEKEAAPIVGLLAATYAAMQFLCAPMLGALSDRFGRRPVLLVALLGSGLDYVAMALAPTVPVLFVTRAVNGLSGASITVASAYIADVTTPEKRAAGYGMMGAAFGLGFILGPLLGGILGDIDLRLPFYVAAGLTLCNWLYGLLVLPESLPKERRSDISWSRANPVGAFVGLFEHPRVIGMAAAGFFANLAQFGLHATWVLYTGHRYGWGPREVGFSLTAVGLGAAIVQGGLARRIIPALGERRSVLLGLGLGVIAYAGYGLATHGWMIYLAIAVATMGGIAQPAAQAIITKGVEPNRQGSVQGALTGLQSVAQIIGPLVGSSAFSLAISGRLGFELPGLSFFVGAALAGAGWMIAAIVLRRHA